MAKHVAVYCRFSVFKDGGTENVVDQEKWGREWAHERFPGQPVEVFCDDGITAAKSDVHRPDFQRLREWVADGRVGQVWATEQTRLARTNLGWFAFASELESAGIDAVHTRRDGTRRLDDLGTDVHAVVSTHEVRKLRKRVNDKLDIRAEQGRPTGGVCFGYEHISEEDGTKALRVVPEQADVLRWAARQLLDGVPKTRIARELAKRGIRGARGGLVGAPTIDSWLTNATVAGFRQHRGELMRDAQGELVRGTWEPILDVDTWQACRAKLAATARTGDRPTRRRYLLSGIAVCECGTRMVGQFREGKGRAPQQRYLCKGCGCGIVADPVHNHVKAQILGRLDTLAIALGDRETALRRKELRGELDAIDDRRALIGRMVGTGAMDEIGYTAARAELDDRETELTVALGELPATTQTIDPDDIRAAWAYNTIDEMRQVISDLVERVVIERAKPGTSRRRVDLNRVRIEGPGWHDDEGDDD